MSGSRYERELVRRFRRQDWAAMRCPASGAATEADLPDVLAGRNATIERARFGPEHTTDDADTRRRSQALAIELKQVSGDYASADLAEVRALRRFAKAFGARPALAVRSTQQATPTRTWLVAPDDCRETEAAYRCTVAELESVAWGYVADDEVHL